MMSPNQKRRLIYTSAFLLIAGWFLVDGGHIPLTAQVFDGAGLQGGLSTAQEEIGGSGIRQDDDIIPAIAGVLNFALTFVAVFAVVAFVVAGFTFILGFGSDAANQRAKKIMIWAAVGLLVIVFSFVIVEFILNLVTS
jgi:hypothetical protein